MCACRLKGTGTNSTSDITAMGPRIISGKDAPPGRFPYAVGLLSGLPKQQEGWQPHFICGGSLIAPNLVLSAGWHVYVYVNWVDETDADDSKCTAVHHSHMMAMLLPCRPLLQRFIPEAEVRGGWPDGPEY
jgi:hypothetical protein